MTKKKELTCRLAELERKMINLGCLLGISWDESGISQRTPDWVITLKASVVSLIERVAYLERQVCSPSRSPGHATEISSPRSLRERLVSLEEHVAEAALPRLIHRVSNAEKRLNHLEYPAKENSP